MICTFSYHHLVMVDHIFPMIMGCTIIYMQREAWNFLEKQPVQKKSFFIGLCLTLFIKLLFNMNLRIVLRAEMGGELHLIKYLTLWELLVMSGD